MSLTIRSVLCPVGCLGDVSPIINYVYEQVWHSTEMRPRITLRIASLLYLTHKCKNQLMDESVNFTMVACCTLLWIGSGSLAICMICLTQMLSSLN